MRWLIHRLSLELFGRSLPVFEFPRKPNVTALGLSDHGLVADCLVADCLKDRFSYLNTYYDHAPHFDLRFDDSPIGSLDFLIASEVFEHIEPPVGDAFRNSARILKPSGILLLTVSWICDGNPEEALPVFHDWKLVPEGSRWVIVNRTPAADIERYCGPVFDGGPGPCLGTKREHFPHLFDWKLSGSMGTPVLENRRRDGSSESFEYLTFHGGFGLVLEMRLFTKGGLAEQLAAANYRSIEFEQQECPAFGIVFPYARSRPIVAHF